MAIAIREAATGKAQDAQNNSLKRVENKKKEPQGSFFFFDLFLGAKKMFSFPENALVSSAALRLITRLFAKKGKSKLVSSPAALPGIGMRRAVRGLSKRRAKAARSSSTASSC
jgi:hypothetical protein